MAIESTEQKVDVLRETIVALVRRDGPDLSARQLGVFLTCYREDEAQTVRGLAAKLDVSKPAITRALDRLSEFDLVRRKAMGSCVISKRYSPTRARRSAKRKVVVGALVRPFRDPDRGAVLSSATSQDRSSAMTDLSAAGTFPLGDRVVNRIGYGAMQLAGPGVFGPPRDHAAARAVLREAVASGVNHIDTSDFYGPHVTNQVIREALHPYPDDLTIVTKVGAVRGADASWNPAQSPADLRQAVLDNLRNLGVDVLDAVNLRVMGDVHAPSEGSIAGQFTALAELQRQGLIRHLGLSNATGSQVEEARAIAPVVCVQNQYNLVHRGDDALVDDLARKGIAYVPFFPLGGFTPLQSSTLSDVAARLGATPMQVALAWLLHRAPNILLIPGTSSPDHLRENLAAAELALPNKALGELKGIRASDLPSA